VSCRCCRRAPGAELADPNQGCSGNLSKQESGAWLVVGCESLPAARGELSTAGLKKPHFQSRGICVGPVEGARGDSLPILFFTHQVRKLE